MQQRRAYDSLSGGFSSGLTDRESSEMHELPWKPGNRALPGAHVGRVLQRRPPPSSLICLITAYDAIVRLRPEMCPVPCAPLISLLPAPLGGPVIAERCCHRTYKGCWMMCNLDIRFWGIFMFPCRNTLCVSGSCQSSVSCVLILHQYTCVRVCIYS